MDLDVLSREGAAILVVDDDPGMRAYVRRCLESLTSRVIEAADGTEALEAARAAGPGGVALVIADVVMPGLDGLALRQALRADPDLAAVPVLLISGEVGSEVARQGPLLRKPFNRRTLQVEVRSLIGGGGAAPAAGTREGIDP